MLVRIKHETAKIYNSNTSICIEYSIKAQCSYGSDGFLIDTQNLSFLFPAGLYIEV